MSSGLIALFDDVAAIAKAAAASLDDVAAQAVKASGKAAGVVIDDAAVTPKYVIGLSPSRELPIVWKIAKGSLLNKIVYLLPGILALGYFAQWSIAPLLAIGGLFLCFEGYEKLHQIIHSFFHPNALHQEPETMEQMTPEQLEQARTAGAIRTDFILSAEIMAISYSVVEKDSFLSRLGSLLVVAFVITVGVYGFVALILKADDLGLHLLKEKFHRWLQLFGRSLILGMPILLQILSYIGTAAMLWVGGGIIIHSLPPAHHAVTELINNYQLTGMLAWCVEAGISLVLGIILGFFVVLIVEFIRKRIKKPAAIDQPS